MNMLGMVPALRVVLVFLICDAVCGSAMLVTTPRILASMREVTPADLPSLYAWTIAAFALGQFLFLPFLGGLSDQIGRKWIMVASAAVISLDYIIAGLATSPAMLIGSRLVAGSASAVNASAFALASDVTASEHRARVFGLLGACIGLGAVLGPFASAALSELPPSVVAWSAAGLSGISAALVASVLVVPKPSGIDLRRRRDWVLLLQSKSRGLAGAFFLGQAAKNLAFAALLPLLMVLGWGPWAIGGCLAFGAISQFLGQTVLLSQALRRLSDAGVGVLALGLASFGYAVLAVGNHPVIVITGVALAGFGTASSPITRSIASKNVKNDMQGTLHGFINSISMAAWFIGPLIMVFDGPACHLLACERQLSMSFYFAMSLSICAGVLLFCTQLALPSHQCPNRAK